MTIEHSVDNAIPQYTNAAEIPEEYRKKHVRPWIRFFAQFFDFYVFTTIVYIIEIFYSSNFFVQYNSSMYDLFITNVIGFFIWAMLEAILLATIGTTLGKALLKVKVRDLNGNKPTLIAALKRSLKLWMWGFGLGIPLINLFTYYFSYRYLKNKGTTKWDQNHFIVTHEKIGFIRAFITFLLWIMGSVFIFWYSFSASFKYFSSQGIIQEIQKESESLPKMLNSDIEYTSVQFKEPLLIYSYRLVNLDKEQVPPSFKEDVRTHLVKELCNSYFTKKFILNRGYQIMIKYNDKNSNLITELDITLNDCMNIN